MRVATAGLHHSFPNNHMNRAGWKAGMIKLGQLGVGGLESWRAVRLDSWKADSRGREELQYGAGKLEAETLDCISDDTEQPDQSRGAAEQSFLMLDQRQGTSLQ